ncbi:hypothetical protein CLU79DRAFT_892139, partial [Phycomyces nitens]
MGYTEDASSALASPLLMDSSTNRAYKRGQSLVNTLQLFRSTILRFHINPSSADTGDLAHLFSSLRRSAPPVSLYRPQVDLAPIFAALVCIPSAFSTSQQILYLVIPIPKETRGGHRIVKSLGIHAHPSFHSLCPVLAFRALRDYPLFVPRPSSSLFVNSKYPDHNIQTSTVSSWLSRLVRLSTSVCPTPSLRSIASDLALHRGTLIENV